MKLSDFISSDFVITNGSAKTLEGGKNQLVELFTKHTQHNATEIIDAMTARENLGSTIIAPGISFPHIREPFLKDFYVMIGCFPKGLPVEGQPEPIRLIAFFLVPEGKSNIYLRVMAALIRLISTPDGITKLVEQGSNSLLIEYIKTNDVQVGDMVTARDIMSNEYSSLKSTATLREAADKFVSDNVTDICIVDDDDNFLGTVTTGRLLKVGIPDYLLMMDNLSFLKTFEPFQDLLKNEQSMCVMDILKKDTPTFQQDTPMIQVAGKLVDGHTEFGVVLDGKKLLGAVTKLDFIHKVVRV